ncbi:MAG: squalene/phytoene synthase family protein [Sphingomonadaceae bacterium]
MTGDASVTMTPTIEDPWRRIALPYAPPSARPALAALWALDEALGRVVAATTQPLIGQLRLTWWHERLCALDAGERLAEPVLAALAAHVLPMGVTGAALVALVEGWEVLLDDLPIGAEALGEYAAGRGGALFALSATVLGSGAERALGEGWALIDFAARCSDPETAERAWQMAGARLDGGISGPKPLRILARLARVRAREPFDRVSLPLSRWTMLRAIL